MPVKVKRGLGLLVIALLGYLVVSLGQANDSAVLESVGYLAVAIGLVGGLGLLAWGLLRD